MKSQPFLFFTTVLLLFLFTSAVYATTYYVSSGFGDDTRSLAQARVMTTPWKTLAGVSRQSANFQPGDSVLFKRGESFFGTLGVSASGAAGSPIVFGAYGDGALLPELTGFVTLSGWQQKNGNIWEAVVPGGLSYMNTVTVNGAAKAAGRYPNATAVNNGYLTYESFNANTSITDSKLASQPNWQGGQIVIRKNRTIIDRCNISSQSGTTINYNSPSGYPGNTGYGYFIQNHPSTLDVEGEWYYQGGKLGIFMSSNPNTYQVRAGVTEAIVRVYNQNNITFENLRLSGATVNTFEIVSSGNVRISNCEVLFSGKNGVYSNGTDGLIVENTTIAHTGNNACNLGGNGIILRNNQIRSTAINAGMGGNDDLTYEGLLVFGDNNLMINNVIDSTGYVPINFSGNNVTIKNNLITNFGFVKDDGGGIYTWNGTNPPKNYFGGLITGNIILNGMGAPDGTGEPNARWTHGIYLDDNSENIEITGNTVANCSAFGLYVHDSHDILIKQNTFYNNTMTQLAMLADHMGDDRPVYNNTITGNILFAKQPSQQLAQYLTKDNDGIADFGTFDHNYYYRPMGNSDITISTQQQIKGVYGYNTPMNLNAWKALYSQDENSIKTPQLIPTYTVTSVTGSNQFAGGTFDSNVGWLYVYSPGGNAATSWESGKLDGGTLKVSFSSTSSSPNFGSVIIGIGSVTAGKSYRLKFSVLGADNYKSINAYLRQSLSPYGDLSSRQGISTTATRQDKEFLFTALASESNASIALDIPEQTSPVYLDNIKLEQVEATTTNPDQYISFFYNPTTTAKTFPTNPGYDVYNNQYSTNVSVQPFQSVIIAADTATTTTATTCSATGTILREQWDNVSGTSISDIPLQTTPASTSQLTSFEGPVNIADNYGSRIRGYICPPQTGSYTFWIAGDDASELWLSTDDNPANKVRVATVNDWTYYREWNKYSSQKSAAINLQAGKKYYVEALEKEGSGYDNLSVQWELPDGSIESPIAGNHLSPYISQSSGMSILNTGSISTITTPFAIAQSDSTSTTAKTGLFVYPNPVFKQAVVEFTLPESGQTDISFYNSKGQFISKIFSGISETNIKNSFILNVETLQSGVYVIHLISGKNSLSKKIIVVK